MDKQIKQIIKLNDGDILIVFSDGSGLSCSDPVDVSNDDVRKIIVSELDMVAESHNRFIELDTLDKTFKTQEAEIIAEAGETDDRSVHERAAELDDAEFAEPTGS